jgi:hypothetical protein
MISIIRKAAESDCEGKAQMKLFNTFERTYMGYKEDGESQYAYLNRSARPQFAAARQVLEEWFVAYPPHAQSELASNFISDDYGPHIGAFFHLYCFALLRAQNLTVQVEQVIDIEKGNPIDLVVGSVHNPDFCVEATVLADSKLTNKSRQQLEILQQHLNHITSNRQLILDVENASKQALPYDEISARVERWLGIQGREEEPASVSERDFATSPSYTWEGDGWKLRFEVMPGVRVDDLVFFQIEGGWLGTKSRLKEKLQDKADQHSGLQVPYIIAMDVLSVEAIFKSTHSVADDLFGREIVLLDPDTGMIITVKRSPELPKRSDREKGLWFGRSGPRNQHVSGVLLVNEVVPWSAMKQTPILWHNPWAKQPISTELWQGPQMVMDTTTGEYRRQEGKAIEEMFGKRK